ncbi:MAG TPA: GntR family transcriptional regulator [Dongiaceae bacterium]|nr:GntR family transcriptional regulator [Dongiaceae bacterium]
MSAAIRRQKKNRVAAGQDGASEPAELKVEVHKDEGVARLNLCRSELGHFGEPTILRSKSAPQTEKTENSRKDHATALNLGTVNPDLPLGEAVYEALRRGLRTGAIKAGDRIKEEEVAASLSVSRTPVREALGRLIAKRFIIPAGVRGLVVRSLDAAEVLELYAMREILEGAAARLAAQQASGPEVDSLLSLQEAYDSAWDDPTEMARINVMFHETIFRAAKNRYLIAALEELQDVISILGPTTFTVAGRPATASAEHRAIIAAISTRNANEAERLAGIHIREALRARLKIMQGDRRSPA